MFTGIPQDLPRTMATAFTFRAQYDRDDPQWQYAPSTSRH